jgi:hypothetical protein
MLLGNITEKDHSFIIFFFLVSIFLIPFIISTSFLLPLSHCLLASFAFFVIFTSFLSKNFIISLNLNFFKLALFIIFHGLISFNINVYSQTPNLQKLSLSLIYLVSVLYFCEITCHSFMKFNSFALCKILNFSSYFLLIAAYVSAFGFLFIHNGGRPVFFYSEPSHFVLVFIPFMLYKLSTSNKLELFLFSAVSYKLAFMMPSATFLFALLFYPPLIKKFKGLIIIYLSFLAVILLTFFLNNFSSLSSKQILHNHNNVVSSSQTSSVDSLTLDSLNYRYFIDRLLISKEPTKNLSRSVYMSGWARAYTNIKNTYGVGIGFQQLGYIGASDKYLDFITRDNSPFGFNEGGCVAAKLLSEFGLLGLIVIVIYLFSCFRVFNSIRSHVNKEKLHYFNNVGFLMDIFYVSFIIPLFIRSSGYFTPLFFTLLISLFYYNTKKRPKL